MHSALVKVTLTRAALTQGGASEHVPADTGSHADGPSLPQQQPGH